MAGDAPRTCGFLQQTFRMRGTAVAALLIVVSLSQMRPALAQTFSRVHSTKDCTGFGMSCTIELTDDLVKEVQYTLAEPITCPQSSGYNDECVVVVNISNSHPEWIVVNPCLLRWTADEWNQTKTVTIKTANDYVHSLMDTRQVHLSTQVTGTRSELYKGYNPSDFFVEYVPTKECRDPVANNPECKYPTVEGQKITGGPKINRIATENVTECPRNYGASNDEACTALGAKWVDSQVVFDPDAKNTVPPAKKFCPYKPPATVTSTSSSTSSSTSTSTSTSTVPTSISGSAALSLISIPCIAANCADIATRANEQAVCKQIYDVNLLTNWNCTQLCEDNLLQNDDDAAAVCAAPPAPVNNNRVRRESTNFATLYYVVARDLADTNVLDQGTPFSITLTGVGGVSITANTDKLVNLDDVDLADIATSDGSVFQYTLGQLKSLLQTSWFGTTSLPKRNDADADADADGKGKGVAGVAAGAGVGAILIIALLLGFFVGSNGGCGGTCKEEGCKEKPWKKELCKRHYRAGRRPVIPPGAAVILLKPEADYGFKDDSSDGSGAAPKPRSFGTWGANAGNVSAARLADQHRNPGSNGGRTNGNNTSNSTTDHPVNSSGNGASAGAGDDLADSIIPIDSQQDNATILLNDGAEDGMNGADSDLNLASAAAASAAASLKSLTAAARAAAVNASVYSAPTATPTALNSATQLEKSDSLDDSNFFRFTRDDGTGSEAGVVIFSPEKLAPSTAMVGRESRSRASVSRQVVYDWDTICEPDILTPSGSSANQKRTTSPTRPQKGASSWPRSRLFEDTFASKLMERSVGGATDAVVSDGEEMYDDRWGTMSTTAKSTGTASLSNTWEGMDAMRDGTSPTSSYHIQVAANRAAGQSAAKVVSRMAVV